MIERAKYEVNGQKSYEMIALVYFAYNKFDSAAKTLKLSSVKLHRLLLNTNIKLIEIKAYYLHYQPIQRGV